MITKFKLFEKIRNWGFKNDKYIYHYTSFGNVLKILNDGFLKVRPFTAFNKYSSSPTEANDYGYVSFTEDMDYHEEEHGGVPIDMRFVFDKKLMNKKYDLQRFDANKEAELVYFDQTDHQSLDCESDELTDDICRYYGEEYELRIYNDVPISNAIRLEFETPPSKEIIDLCKGKNIELKEW